MSRYTMKAFAEVCPTISTVKIKGRGKKSIESFIEFCKKNFPNIKEYIVCETIEESCKNADIVFYGTTNAANYEDNPTVKYEWLKKGALVISASALLVDTEFLSKSDVKLISDNYNMYDGWGSGQPLPTQKNVSTLLGMGFYDAVTEGKITRDMITDIGEVICKDKTGRDNEEQTILYAVGGMPIEDVAWGYDIYMNANYLINELSEYFEDYTIECLDNGKNKLKADGNRYNTYIADIKEEYLPLCKENPTVVIKEIAADKAQIYSMLSDVCNPYLEKIYDVIDLNGTIVSINEFVETPKILNNWDKRSITLEQFILGENNITYPKLSEKEALIFA